MVRPLRAQRLSRPPSYPFIQPSAVLPLLYSTRLSFPSTHCSFLNLLISLHLIRNRAGRRIHLNKPLADRKRLGGFLTRASKEHWCNAYELICVRVLRAQEAAQPLLYDEMLLDLFVRQFSCTPGCHHRSFGHHDVGICQSSSEV